MITQTEYFHGAALARLFRGTTGADSSIRVRQIGRSSYSLDDSAVLYLKYSSNRMSPWNFSFTDEHQFEITSRGSTHDLIFIGLICGSDGIACLSQLEYRSLLDDQVAPVEWIKAVRSAREKYALSGSDSSESIKIGNNEYPSKIHAELSRKRNDSTSLI